MDRLFLRKMCLLSCHSLFFLKTWPQSIALTIQRKIRESQGSLFQLESSKLREETKHVQIIARKYNQMCTISNIHKTKPQSLSIHINYNLQFRTVT